MSIRTWWALSVVFSLACLAALVVLWTKKASDVPTPAILTSADDLDRALAGHEGARRQPTGIHLDVLHFVGSYEVEVAGILWQRFAPGDPVPGRGEVPFAFPEQVDVERVPYEIDREEADGSAVVVWRFRARVRQTFDYEEFPFDHKRVWFRIWPRDLSGSTVLTPDLIAYEDLSRGALFGLGERIELGGWEVRQTYFAYRAVDRDIDFGIGLKARKSRPELLFNVLITRNSLDALVFNVLPLFVVAALLFALLVTATRHDGLRGLHGFSTSRAIATCAALFFVVMVTHIRLREELSGSDIVFIEYFYFLVYAILLGVTVNSHVFARRLSLADPSAARRRASMVVPLIYWPCLLGTTLLITVIRLGL